MKKTQPLKITIVIAVFNGERTLQRCIDSIVSQTYLNKELIIIDGVSQDNTVNLIKKNDKHISYWVSEPDNGIYDAWNKGVLVATGDWIWFLGADDYLYANTSMEDFSLNLSAIPPSIKIAYSKVQLVNQNQGVIYSIGESWEKSKNNFLKHMCLPHQGLLHHKTLFTEHSLFNTNFKIAGDYELLLRELPHNDAFFYPFETVCMQVGGVSSDPFSSVRTVKEIRYAQKIHGQKTPNLFILLALIRAYCRVFIFSVFGEKISYKLMDMYRVLMGKKVYWNKSS